ncbi:Rv3654c family TadE-like protein [Corynebacterium sp.]|uniref:Rv3654c family TadE-like protein n=1 Tax=Corynebacterium sp. TaxID=1720 RepID=UPI0026DD7EEB|nr:Rv3654c family TadE-like protein [Corynebacterium sp.]MDO5031876.1 flp pilus-assembly TadE/G-like family protein [Corynebacterium sp.]
MTPACPGRRRAHADDAGYATVVTAGIIAALTGLLIAVAAVGARVVARHEAQVAADLSAVAGAWSITRGNDACAAAEHTAGLNGAELVGCQVSDQDVIATATVRGREAIARAGPV